MACVVRVVVGVIVDVAGVGGGVVVVGGGGVAVGVIVGVSVGVTYRPVVSQRKGAYLF